MTRIPELEQQLIAAGERHYGRRRPTVRLRPAVPVLVAATVVAAVVAIAAGGGAPDEREAAPATAPSTLPEGLPPTPQELELLRNPELEDETFAVLGPEGSPPRERERWLVVPASGNVCLIVPSGIRACATRERYEREGLTLIDDEQFKGIAPPQFVEAEVRHSAGLSAPSVGIDGGVFAMPAVGPQPITGSATVITLSGEVRRLAPTEDFAGPATLELRLLRDDGSAATPLGEPTARRLHDGPLPLATP